ncbi:MAG: hypothetical protein AB7S59_15480 [Parvibaculaceae bacterium]
MPLTAFFTARFTRLADFFLAAFFFAGAFRVFTALPERAVFFAAFFFAGRFAGRLAAFFAFFAFFAAFFLATRLAI